VKLKPTGTGTRLRREDPRKPSPYAFPLFILLTGVIVFIVFVQLIGAQ